MGTKLICFSHNQKLQWGTLRDDQIHIVPFETQSLKVLLTEGKAAIDASKKSPATLTLQDVTLQSPVTRDAHIYCQGTNYGFHRVEAGFTQQKPPYNLLFTKASSTLTSADANIICPPHVKLLDYEIELGIIIGKPIHKRSSFTETNVHDYIAGLVITNDISARDVQIVEQQWFKGKSYRGFCPVGPYIYLLDANESDLLHHLHLTLKVNGEVRQQVQTNHLLFKPHETLSEMSEIFDLDVGDLIMTGTPGGVALRLDADILQAMADNQLDYHEKQQRFIDSQRQDMYLKDGDTLSLTIQSIDGLVDLGEQTNQIVQRVSVT